jgi:hypothetical protein
MAYHPFKRPWFASLFVAGVVLALASCGATRSTSLPGAQVILKQATQATVKDASFSFRLGDGSSGTGQLTTNPERTLVMLSNLSSANSSSTNSSTATHPLYRYLPFHQQSDEVSSGSSLYPVLYLVDRTGYYIRPVYPSSPWTQISVQDLVSNDLQRADVLLMPDLLDYSQLHGARVLGGESVGGVPTWRLQGTHPITPALAQALGRPEILSEQVWIRQDTGYPAKMVLSVEGASNLTITYVFTQWNTGAAIGLPSLLSGSGT